MIAFLVTIATCFNLTPADEDSNSKVVVVVANMANMECIGNS